MHPVFEEMKRARLPIQDRVWQRWLRALETEIQPILDAAVVPAAEDTPKRRIPRAGESASA